MNYGNLILPMKCTVTVDAGADHRTPNSIWQAEMYGESGQEYFKGHVVNFFPDVAIVCLDTNIIVPVPYQYVRYNQHF